jgi:ABC-type polysaccharide/polyol phosphate transport system ATPase subunit
MGIYRKTIEPDSRIDSPAILVENLHKTFRLQHRKSASIKYAILNFYRKNPVEKREALKGVSFKVEHGETVALVGKNGSGKSTLLSIMAHVYKPTSGIIQINGKIATLLELGAGFHPDLTGVENVELYGAILGLTIKEIHQKFDSIVKFAFDTPDLAEKIDTPLRNYSEGMKMRLGFSLAVHTDPDILLIDEVLAVGDEAFQQKCYRKIEEFQNEGKTIVFVAHYAHIIRQVASRVIWMHNGLIRMDGPLEPTLEAYLKASDDPNYHAKNS